MNLNQYNGQYITAKQDSGSIFKVEDQVSHIVHQEKQNLVLYKKTQEVG